jgi:hypothetical protein
VMQILLEALRHRIILSPQARGEWVSEDDVLKTLFQQI